MADNRSSTRDEKTLAKSRAWPYALHDLTVRSDVCNLRCKYCGLAVEHVPPMTLQGGLVGLRGADGELINMEPAAEIAQSARVVAQRVHERHASALKISGGELSSVPQWLDLLFDLARSMDNVQLLSNGLALNPETVSRITRAKNLVVQISLDGHTAQANQYRGLSQSGVERILSAIQKIVAAGMRVEINVVLHNLNLNSFGAFAAWASTTLSVGSGTLKLLPRPVRGPTASAMRGHRAQIEAFLEDLKNAPAEVLPPEPYLKRLGELLLTGSRKWPCYVPHFVLGTDEHGEIAVCTCGSHLGTAGFIRDNPTVLNDGPFFAPKSAIDQCSDCMTQYEMFNLYLEEEISAAQCDIYPMQRLPRTQLEQLRNRILEHTGKADRSLRKPQSTGDHQEEL